MNSARQPSSSRPFAARARRITASNDADPLYAEFFMRSANSTTDEANRNDSVGSAGVLLVVVEVLRREQPAIVAEQTVRGDLGRVELQLQLHVLGDRHHRAAELRHYHLLRLEDAVEERVVPVSGVRQLLIIASW